MKIKFRWHVRLAPMFAMLPMLAFAPNHIVSWDPAPGQTNVSYRVFSSTNGLGAAAMNWKFERLTTSTTVLLSNLPTTVLSFAVTATNSTGESDKAEVEILKKPLNVRSVAATE